MKEKKRLINGLIQTKMDLKDFAPKFLGISYAGYNERWRVNSWTKTQIMLLNSALTHIFGWDALLCLICEDCHGWQVGCECDVERKIDINSEEAK